MSFVNKRAFASAFQIEVKTHIVNILPPSKLLRASYNVNQFLSCITHNPLSFWHNSFFIFTFDHVLTALSKNFVKPKHLWSPLSFIIFKRPKVRVWALEFVCQSIDFSLSCILL